MNTRYWTKCVGFLSVLVILCASGGACFADDEEKSDETSTLSKTLIAAFEVGGRWLGFG